MTGQERPQDGPGRPEPVVEAHWDQPVKPGQAQALWRALNSGPRVQAWLRERGRS